MIIRLLLQVGTQWEKVNHWSLYFLSVEQLILKLNKLINMKMQK
jgi:hypothetical protein